MEELARQILAVALLSLRFAPTFAYAPPFTLMRIPARVRVALGVTLAAALASAQPANSWDSGFLSLGIVRVAAAELFLGITLALALQLAFAMIGMMGRSLDIQAGFGMALLLDPATRGQSPLIGTFLGYGAAVVFFLDDGPAELLGAMAASLDRIPLGMAGLPDRVAPLLTYLGTLSVLALGLVGLLLVALFLVDIFVAFLSRTLPQMNVLLLGFQAKALVTLILLPVMTGLAGSGYARIINTVLTSPLLVPV